MKATEPATPGKRLLSIPPIKQVGGNSAQLLDEMPADGRFHIFVYAGRSLTSEAFVRLSEFLSSPTSPVHHFSKKTPHHLGPFHQEDITSTYPTANFDYVVEVFLLHTTPHLEVDLELCPSHSPISGPPGCMKMSIVKAMSYVEFPRKTARWFLSDPMDM